MSPAVMSGARLARLPACDRGKSVVTVSDTAFRSPGSVISRFADAIRCWTARRNSCWRSGAQEVVLGDRPSRRASSSCPSAPGRRPARAVRRSAGNRPPVRRRAPSQVGPAVLAGRPGFRGGTDRRRPSRPRARRTPARSTQRHVIDLEAQVQAHGLAQRAQAAVLVLRPGRGTTGPGSALAADASSLIRRGKMPSAYTRRSGSGTYPVSRGMLTMNAVFDTGSMLDHQHRVRVVRPPAPGRSRSRSAACSAARCRPTSIPGRLGSRCPKAGSTTGPSLRPGARRCGPARLRGDRGLGHPQVGTDRDRHQHGDEATVAVDRRGTAMGLLPSPRADGRLSPAWPMATRRQIIRATSRTTIAARAPGNDDRVQQRLCPDHQGAAGHSDQHEHRCGKQQAKPQSTGVGLAQAGKQERERRGKRGAGAASRPADRGQVSHELDTVNQGSGEGRDAEYSKGSPRPQKCCPDAPFGWYGRVSTFALPIGPLLDCRDRDGA